MTFLTLLRNIFFIKNGKHIKPASKEMSNVVDSMFNSKDLYDTLKIKCHPDRFPNDIVKQEKAQSLFQELQKNRYNVAEMKRLKILIDEL